MIVKRTWWGFMDIMDILTTMIIGTIVFIGLGLFITYIIIKSGVKSGVKEGLGEVKTVSKSQSKEAVEVKPAKTEAVIDDDFADFKDEFKVEVKRYINKKISEFGLEEFKEDVERRLNRFFKREFDKFYKEDEDMQNLFKKFVDGEDIFELDVCRNKIKEIALKVNEVLKKLFDEKGIILVDFKIEIGRDKDGNLLVADEISPDTMRLWDKETRDVLDKDVFRKDLGDVIAKYRIVAERLGLL